MNELESRAAEKILWERVGRAATEHLAPLPQISIQVRVQEVGDGDPALFIPGGPNAGSTWTPLLQHLEGFRCLLVDRPGTCRGSTNRPVWRGRRRSSSPLLERWGRRAPHPRLHAAPAEQRVLHDCDGRVLPGQRRERGTL